MEAVTQLLKPATDYWLLTDRFKDIEGFLEPIEGYALHTIAAFGPGKGEIVEIGSLYGRSTCYLASGSARNGRGVVYAIDTFKGSREHQAGEQGEQAAITTDGSTLKIFLKNIATHRFDEKVKPIVNESSKAVSEWSKSIRLLFIDGDHSYEATRKDFLHWSPYVPESGLIAFHDVTTWDGVTLFYNEITQLDDWKEVLAVGTIRVIQRLPHVASE